MQIKDFDGNIVTVKETIPDKVIKYFDPILAARRLHARTVSALLGGYTGASRTDRSMKGWRHTTGASPDDDTINDLPTLRDRARDSTRNNPVGSAIINTSATNIIGPGLAFHSRIDREYLKLTDEKADENETQIEREWRLFWNTKDISLHRGSTGDELADIACRQVFENGEAFCLYPWRERPNSVYATRLQLIEADRVCNPDRGMDTDNRVMGIEFDDDRVPKLFHIASRHPYSYSGSTIKWQQVPAYSPSGRRYVNHMFKPTRPDQTRGVPFIAPVISALKQLTRYTDAELMAAVVSGMFTVFVKTEKTPETGMGLGSFVPGLTEDTQSSATTDESYKLGNGAIVGLNANQSIDLANPSRPNSVFDTFVIAILRQIGAALEIPFEILMKHFTASYSASRAALLEAWRFFLVRRKWFVTNFYMPAFELFMDEAVARGRIIAPGYFEDPLIRMAWLGCEWVGAPRGMIDEEKELKAAQLKLNMNISTKQRLTAETSSEDWDQVIKRRGKEKKKEEEQMGKPEPAASPFGKPAGDKPEEKQQQEDPDKKDEDTEKEDTNDALPEG